MPAPRPRIRAPDQAADRVRGVPLAHPGCAPLVAAGVRCLGLDWRIPGSTWGEGISPTLLFFWVATGQVTMADGSATAGPGQCLVVPPATPKRLTAPDGALHAAYVHVAARRPWTTWAGAARVLPAPRARHVAALIAALADETVGAGTAAVARPVAAAVLACCSALTEEGSASPRHAERDRLQALWDEVAAQPALPWTVRGLARRAGMSEGHFHRRVQAWHGCAPMAVVRQLRLGRATDLLRTSNATLAEIAAQVGYANPFALSHALHRHLGRRPRQLRGEV